ncbi:primosomal protein N' [Larsenimonas rhizosphaerae]|uniref:primosomal protein N' n=1 Tax=Larsenimonas rhizosphaerae TaxID=2944682 RepID=UPI0020334A77|nr:primosomal protein N' [Larsenimonas rhizosphaerae]MCM2129701.1 primosomal protein N' [Larsenimonas rhizosphaerae]
MPDPFSAAPRIIEVAIPTPLRRCFDYLPGPDTPVQGWQPGLRVKLSFGHRDMVGIVVGTKQDSDVPTSRLKPIKALIDQTPLPADWLALCRFTARYYQHSLGDTLFQALPVLLRQGRPLEARTLDRWRLTSRGQKTSAEQLGRAHKQAELLDMLRQHRRGMPHTAITAQGFTRQQLEALAGKGLVEVHTEQAIAPPRDNHETLAEPSLTLSREQSEVLAALHAQLGRFSPSLLHGVTGSGKTEVYLQLIEAVLHRRQQALVLIPEIGLTPQTLDRFRRRFNVPIVALHSGMSDNERLDAWEAAGAGRARIIIGTRSAVFTPMAALGIIIIDEEHDDSFKQQDGLRYHARDLALVRAQSEHIPVVLGTATPSLVTLRHARDGRYHHLHLTRRAGHSRKAHIELLDIRGRPQDGGLTPPALEAIREQLALKRQVLIFINRRGYAPTLACHQCGWLAECPRCDARLTLHRHPPELICHHCDHHVALPDACPSCHSGDLRPQGSGTERTEDALATAFPDTQVLRVDRDSTRRKDALQHTLDIIHRGDPCLLVGTQMLAKGHHFPHITLVVVVNADGGLYSADYRALETSAQLLIQVAGRAGRAEHPGRVLIQTHHPDDPGLLLLAEQGYDALAERLLVERRQAGLPPYRHLMLLRGESPHQQNLLELFGRIGEALRGHVAAHDIRVDCLGPVPAPMERRQGRYHVQLMLAADGRAPLHDAGAWLVHYMEQLPEARRLRWSLDVDPVALD